MTVGRVRILSTLFSRDPPMPIWQERVDMLAPRGRSLDTIREILRRADGYSIVILDGSGRPDQLAAILLRLTRPRLGLVIADSTWKRDATRWKYIMNRIGIRLIDSRRTTYCVHSRFEIEAFPRTWGPLRGRVHFTPWACTLKQPDFDSLASDEGRVFAGGNSLRDYGPLIAAAPHISAPIDIATDTLTPDQLAACPRNVVAASLPPAEYERRLFAASVVVVPLQARQDRSAGQTTYVNAMALGKAIVITDTPGVRDYIRDGETGIIVPPEDPEALARAVQRLVSDPSERRRLGERAREYALRELTLTHYASAILDAADAMAAITAPEPVAPRLHDLSSRAGWTFVLSQILMLCRSPRRVDAREHEPPSSAAGAVDPPPRTACDVAAPPAGDRADAPPGVG